MKGEKKNAHARNIVDGCMHAQAHVSHKSERIPNASKKKGCRIDAFKQLQHKSDL